MAHIRKFGRFYGSDDKQCSRHGYNRREEPDRRQHSHSASYQPSYFYYSHPRHPHQPADHQYHHRSHDQAHIHGTQSVSVRYNDHGRSNDSSFRDDGRRVESEEHRSIQIVNCTQSTNQAQHDYRDQSHHELNRKRKWEDTSNEGEVSMNSSKKLKGPSSSQPPIGSVHIGFNDNRNMGFSSRHKTNRKQITYLEVMPYPAEGMEVLYTNELDKAESWLQSTIINNSVEAIGLDIEWRPQFVSKKLGGTENKTAVIQLSVEESCLVLHIFHMKNHPTSLSQVLLDKNILKVGSGINGDVIKLLKDTGLLCDGRVDTQEYARALGFGQSLGLKSLSKEVLDIEMDKPKRISLSNWESFPLNKRQIQYAALDAWISLKLYLKLKKDLDEQNKGNKHPKTIQVHYGQPALGKKASKEKRKEWIKNLLSNRVTDKEDCSTATTCESSIPGNINKNQKPTTAKIQAEKREESKDTAGSQNLPKRLKVKAEPCQSGISAECSTISNSICDKSRSATTFAKEHKKNVIIGNKTEFLLCPIPQCRNVKFTLEKELQEHIKTKHVTCKVCGKIYRSKVSAKHKKWHREQSEQKQ